jgi:hypothetical protein
VTGDLKRKALWEHPWGYVESFIIAIELLLLGFIVEYISGGKGISPVPVPYNFYILSGFAGSLIYLRLAYNQHAAVKWLSSVPAAISSIVTFGIVTLLLGFISQNPSETPAFVDKIGLTHLKTSWVMLFAQLFLLSSLGMVIIKRIFVFKWKNIAFILNHFGLWLALSAALVGSGDIQRLTINLLESGESNNIAISRSNEAFRLPFELRLLDFQIEEYEPRLILVDNNTNPQTSQTELITDKDKIYTLKKWKIAIDQYINDAIIEDSIPFYNKVPGSFPAVLVKIKNIETGADTTAWLGTGSFAYNPLYINLEENVVLGLTMPEPKKFKSEVVVSENGSAKDTITIEVNKPYTIQGWKIYQLSYDENKGKWSTLSVLEAINDPWIKVVYIGIFMMIGGSLLLFWTGRQRLN